MQSTILTKNKEIQDRENFVEKEKFIASKTAIDDYKFQMLIKINKIKSQRKFNQNTWQQT